MALFKCKMCGGSLEVSSETVALCEWCGTKQTLPKLNNDRRVNLYDRANHFRRNNEFDKAAGIYEQILNEDQTDAEAYWSLVLCRFGIEYVEDPATHKRLPTINRTQFTSVFDDDNYKSALQYADADQRSIYEAEAKAINEIQKGILAISQKEEPFDVFICYKETDQNGRRTPDSVLATELYNELKREGFKVFFSRITLEDKLGSAYEPYIFAALNSAKVMVVLGTKPEYFNAVWVKNEWSRYLALIKQGQRKMLIPAYRDMDPYDLPEEFSHLQAQDMSKLGFMHDLVHGIKKLADVQKPQPAMPQKQPETVQPVAAAAPLLERAFMFLEDGEWARADEFCEQVLNIEPKNAMAYVGKMMVELRVRKQAQLRDYDQPFENNSNYQKALRFGDEKLKTELQGYIEHIKTRNENTRKDRILAEAGNKLNSDSLSVLETAYEKLASIPGWKNADELAQQCREKIEQRKKELEEERIAVKRQEKIFTISIASLALVIVLAIVVTQVIIPVTNYNQAVKLMEAGKYEEAIAVFTELDDYKDSVDLIEKCEVNIEYNNAVSLMEAGKYRKAIAVFTELDGYKDSNDKITVCQTAIQDGKYNDAAALMESGKYEEAIAAFTELDGYKDSVDLISECNYKKAVVLMEAGNNREAAVAFYNIKDYKDAKAQSMALWEQIAQWDAISAGHSHTVGLKADGTVVAVGENDYDQCDVSGWTDIVAISADSHTVGLKADGTVVAVGYNYSDQCDVSGWTDIVAISAGMLHTVGLKADGTVVAVGSNYNGQCKVSGWRDIVAISAGAYHTVGLKADGTVVAVGDHQYDVSGWTDIVAISAGYNHTVGLKADGTVVAVGDNDDDQCDVSGWKDIVAISARYDHTVGLKADGTVVAVGSNYYGQCDVSGWTDIVAVSAGVWHTVGLKADGTVVAVGDNDYDQCDVSDWKGIKTP